MPIDTGTLLLAAQAGWNYSKTNTGFEPAQQRGSLRLSLAADTTVYNHVFGNTYTLAASAVQAVDVRSFTNFVGESVTATKVLAILVSATGEVQGGQIRLQPDTTNPLQWFFGGSDPAITLTVGSLLQAGMLIQDGAPFTLTSAACRLKLSNPGSSSVTASIAVIVGTT